MGWKKLAFESDIIRMSRTFSECPGHFQHVPDILLEKYGTNLPPFFKILCRCVCIPCRGTLSHRKQSQILKNTVPLCVRSLQGHVFSRKNVPIFQNTEPLCVRSLQGHFSSTKMPLILRMSRTFSECPGHSQNVPDIFRMSRLRHHFSTPFSLPLKQGTS